jgi:hypothetical protein
MSLIGCQFFQESILVDQTTFEYMAGLYMALENWALIMAHPLDRQPRVLCYFLDT